MDLHVKMKYGLKTQTLPVLDGSPAINTSVLGTTEDGSLWLGQRVKSINTGKRTCWLSLKIASLTLPYKSDLIEEPLFFTAVLPSNIEVFVSNNNEGFHWEWITSVKEGDIVATEDTLLNEDHSKDSFNDGIVYSITPMPKDLCPTDDVYLLQTDLGNYFLNRILVKSLC